VSVAKIQGAFVHFYDADVASSVGNVGAFVISDAKFKRSRCLLCSDIALGRSICFTK